MTPAGPRGASESRLAAAQMADPKIADPRITDLGKQLFFDPALSASGKLSCAGCHDPTNAYAPRNRLAVQLGGPRLHTSGIRAVPSLRYTLDRTPVWTHVRAASLAERLTETDSVPTGGFTWDGRFNTLRDQAMFPFFAANEMANPSVAALAAEIADAPYAQRFRAVFGRDIFDDPAKTVARAAFAIERFELEDASFHPYSSKFDAWMDGKAILTSREERGKRLFDDPASGNCASCHIDRKGANGAHPLFTDYQFEAVGVPRNSTIPQNRDPHWYDMGLCGPVRTDAASSNATYCGLFKTPTLRNVTTRGAFFHNGRFHTLRETLDFYVQRDTRPERWYPLGKQGNVIKFDDLPSAFRRNVDTVDAPLTLKRGQTPVWSEQDIEDVIAFLGTLRDEDAAGTNVEVHRAGQNSDSR